MAYLNLLVSSRELPNALNSGIGHNSYTDSNYGLGYIPKVSHIHVCVYVYAYYIRHHIVILYSILHIR